MDSGSAWLPVAEIARRTGRADSTIRSWARRFHDLIPARTDPAGATLYPLAAFRLVETMASQRRPTEAIRAELTRRSGLPDDAPVDSDWWQAAMLEELRAIRAAVERIADRLDHPD